MKNGVKMRRFIFFLLLISVFATTVQAKEYFVRNDGNDHLDGQQDATAWRSIGKVNSFRFSAGDVLNLKRGSVFNDTTLLSPDVDNFTVQDYGDPGLPKPRIDANKIVPIKIIPNEKINNLIIRNIDISGQNCLKEKATLLTVVNVHNVMLDGIWCDGYVGGGHYGKNGIFVGGLTEENSCTGNIIIKNNRLTNLATVPILTEGTDFIGLVLGRLIDAEVLVQDNVIGNCTADCLQVFLCKADITIKRNELYDAGENSIDIKSSSNVMVEGNKLYRRDSFRGHGGSGGGSIVGIHDPYSVGGISNIKVYENEFAGGDNTCISVSDEVSAVEIFSNKFTGDNVAVKIAESTHVSVYHNVFNRCRGNIFIKNGAKSLEIYGNLLVDPLSLSQADYEAGCIYENNAADPPAQIYNNTIANIVGSCASLVNIASSHGTILKNNIIYQLNGIRAKPLMEMSHGKMPVLSNNCWYKKSGGVFATIKDKSYALENAILWKNEHKSILADPLFIDASGGDFRLSSGSPCIGKGVDLGSKYHFVFDSDITTIPFPVVEQDIVHNGWTIGAMAYQTHQLKAPVLKELH